MIIFEPHLDQFEKLFYFLCLLVEFINKITEDIDKNDNVIIGVRSIGAW